MAGPTALRRLIDLPGVRDLEFKALMNPRFADIEAPQTFPEIDDCARSAFGLSTAEAEDVARPADWDGIEARPLRDQIIAFEAEGWNVTDDKRRPLRLLGHFSAPLWLAMRGVAGALPFQPDSEGSDLASSLAAEAARFRRNRP